MRDAHVPHIPTLLCHGDVPGQRTATQDVWKKIHGTSADCPLKSHQHYRMVVKEVGLPLSDFKNGKELIALLLDCLEGMSCLFLAVKQLLTVFTNSA